jgi:hypothetical protein
MVQVFVDKALSGRFNSIERIWRLPMVFACSTESSRIIFGATSVANPTGNVTAGGARVETVNGVCGLQTFSSDAVPVGKPGIATEKLWKLPPFCSFNRFSTVDLALWDGQEAQLTAQSPCEGIDRAQEFVTGAVDHWGHSASEGLLAGPDRAQFWSTTLGICWKNNCQALR